MDRIRPFYRLLLLILLISALLLASSFAWNVALFILIALLIGVTGIDKRELFRPLYKLRHFLLLIFLLNSLFSDEGSIFSFLFFRCSLEGIIRAFIIVYRVSIITLLAEAYTLSTGISEISSCTYLLLFPLKLFFIPVEKIASAMSLALYLIDEFSGQSEKLKRIRKLRSLGNEESLREKIVGYKAIVIPIFIMAFRRSDELSFALVSRGYSAGMKADVELLKCGIKEVTALLLAILLIIGEII